MDNYTFLKKNLLLLIADIFDYPEEKYFRISEKNILLNNLGFMKKFYPSKKLSKFFDILFNYLEKINNKEIEKIKKEHFDFFTSPKAKYPPYASYFIEGKLFGKSFFEMKERFFKEGYKLSKMFGNTEDYISSELEYIYHIYENKKKLNEFLDTHFKKWFLKFYEEISKEKISEFYKICLEIIKTLIEEE